jgi:hypothetical protein
VLTGANEGRLAGQQGVAATSAVKTALTVAALGTTAYARLLGKKLERAGDVPVEGGTTPNPTTPEEVTRAQRQLTALQWVIPVLTGAVLVVNARMGEQQRPAQVSKAWSGGCSQVARWWPPAQLGIASWCLEVAVGVLPVRAICRARPGRPLWSVQATSRRAGGRRTLEAQARRRLM